MTFDRVALGVLLSPALAGIGACSGCLSPSAAAALGPEQTYHFDQVELFTGPAERQTVLTGSFLGGEVADILVLDFDEHDDLRLRAFAFDGGTWVPRRSVALRSSPSFVDVIDVGGRDRLLTYARGRLSWLDLESVTEHELAAVPCTFAPRGERGIPHVDVTHDVNGDGRTDLVVPGDDGFRVLVRTGGETFARAVKVGRAPDFAGINGSDGYRYDPWSQSRVHSVDRDLDGRADLAFWNGEDFEVHHQGEGGLFDPLAATFASPVPFDSDRLAWLATGDMEGRVLHSWTDLDGDGAADLVVATLEGRKVPDKRSSYALHFGAPGAGGLSYTPDPDVVLRSDGVQLGVRPHDFDRDGQVDLMFTALPRQYLESHWWWNARGFMGDSIFLDLELYRMEGGRYRDRPGTTRDVILRFPPTHREPGWVSLDLALRGATHVQRTAEERRLGAFDAPLLVGDVTGDGRDDLLVGRARGALRVHAGVPGSGMFAPMVEVGVTLPYDGEFCWLEDLDRDGKQDVVMHHPSSTGPRRVTVLMSR